METLMSPFKLFGALLIVMFRLTGYTVTFLVQVILYGARGNREAIIGAFGWYGRSVTDALSNVLRGGSAGAPTAARRSALTPPPIFGESKRRPTSERGARESGAPIFLDVFDHEIRPGEVIDAGWPLRVVHRVG